MFSQSLREGWGDWEIRVLVIVSLCLQTILILFGSRRKHITTNWLRFLVWVAYLSADWVATVALSLLSIKHLQYKDYSKNPEYILTAFWAPFLLLHLGGPDTITAYSLEDNELFWRHFLMLLVQTGVAVHVLFRAWTGNSFNYLSVPVFVAGIIKFGERSWVLRCAKGDFFRESMFPGPDPGPNYGRFMEVYRARKEEGYLVSLGKINDDPTVGDHSYPLRRNLFDEAARLQDAFFFFKMVKRLFADLILSVHDVVNSRSLFNSRKCDMVFEVIEIELGFMFDVLYTKAVLIHSRIGFALRFVSFSCTASVLLALSRGGEREEGSNVDMIITYALLAGAVLLELYSFSLLLSSDWTRLWLSNHRNAPMDLFYRAVSGINRGLRIRRWSNLMAQYNLIEVSREDNPAGYRCFSFLMRIPVVSPVLKKYLYRSYAEVPKELKELVLSQLKESFKDPTMSSSSGELKRFCAQRGIGVLERRGEPVLEKLKWSVEEAEFEESVLLWHVATELCYREKRSDADGTAKETCKVLSEYMMYLLVMRPSMVPNGIGEIRFQDTCAELAGFCEEKKSSARERDVFAELLGVSTEIPPSAVKGDRSKSVLFDACRLAKLLRGDEVEWKLVSEVWVEMLCYAASQCRRTQHAQQLRQGGELLTHVWLLMAHLGITEQFQISNGHTRARLNLH